MTKETDALVRVPCYRFHFGSLTGLLHQLMLDGVDFGSEELEIAF